MNFLFASVLTQNVDIGGAITPFPVALAPGAFDWVSIDEPNGLLKLRTRLPGDANRDGKVDFADLVAVAQNYGTPGTPEDYYGGGDFNGDDTVDFQDLIALAQHYGTSDLNASDQIDLPYTPFDIGLAQAPEPNSALLLTAAITPLLTKRRRK